MKLAILYTGGTIGCVGSPLQPLSSDAFKKDFSYLISPILLSQYADCSIEFINFYSDSLDKTLDSTNLQPSDWCQMAQLILSHYAEYDGFIILHGTDTMAWSAAALSFFLTGLSSQGECNAVLNKAIIITGSQLPLFCQHDESCTLTLRFNTDALQNICGAVTAAYSQIPEVCIYFNNTLLRGNRAIKSNASEFNAFSTPNYPVLGQQGIEFSLAVEYIRSKAINFKISLENQLVREQLQQQLKHISQQINKITVMPFLAFPAYYDENSSALAGMLSACIEQGVDGIILESYGSGNFPSGNVSSPQDGAIYQCLKKAREQGVMIVDCTQVLTGTVNLKTYAAGSWLADTDINAIGALDMIATASLCKLIYLLSLKDFHQWNEMQIEQLMQGNLCGEIRN